MSTTIDQRVVEMRFDNKQFEQNVSSTMSMIDKLKNSLNLTGATKGMEDVGKAAGRIDLSGLVNGAEQVAVKFSYMQSVVAHQLNRIVDNAVNAGKRIASALTIDPIKTGFSEYETQINAVQTILANTKSKGTTIGDVNAALDELNTYADKTIYNFTEMTRNIGTFTAAGVDLDKSVTSIKGIANLAAVSGSTSQQASTAMYQLSQALAAGKVSLMDWNSVVNAGMGGEVFQEALKRTARNMGKNVDAMIKKYGSFRESLTQGNWLTTEVLTETLTQLSGAYSKADLIAQGFTEKQANEILELADTAVSAATKVKTFTQLWDTLKESAQSGWTQTWEIVVGDFEEAKEMLTQVSDTLGEMIGSSAESRNNLLSGALDTNWEKMIRNIGEAGIESTKFEEKLRSAMEAHGLDVDALIKEHGSLEKVFRSGAVSSDILKEALDALSGTMVDLSSVERELKKGDKGDDVKLAQEALKNLGHNIGKAGVDGKFGKNTEAAVKAFQELHGLEVTGVIDDKTLEALQEASKASANLAENCKKFIDSITELGGREKIIEGVKNAFNGLMNIFKPIKKAFTDIFPPLTVKQLSSFIDGFRNLTKTFEEFAAGHHDQIYNTFKGLFSILDIGWTVVKTLAGGIVEVLKSFSWLGDAVLNVTSFIGNWLTNLRDGVKTTDIFGTAINTVVGYITTVVGWFKTLGQSVHDAFAAENYNGFVGFFKGLWDIVKSIGSGLVDIFGGITDGIAKAFGENTFADVLNSGLVAGILAAIMKFSGSLSKPFEGLSGIFEAFTDDDGIFDNIKGVLEDVRGCFQAYQDSLKADTLKKIATAIAILAAAIFVLSTIDGDALDRSLGAITLMFGELLGSLALFEKLAPNLKGVFKATTLLNGMATALLILSAAVKIMSTMSWDEIARGLVGTIATLASMVAALHLMPDKTVTKASKAMVKMATALVILGAAMHIMASLSWDELLRGLAGVGGGLVALVTAVNLLPKDMALRTLGMIGLATAMTILGGAMHIMASLSWDELKVGLAGMAGALTAVTLAVRLLPKDAALRSAGMIGLATSLLILAAALKSFGSMNVDEIFRGLGAMGGALIELAIALNLMQGCIGGSAALIIAAGALAIIAPVLKVLGGLSWGEIAKGLVAIAGAFAIVGIAGLVLAPIIPTLLALAGAFALFGIATLGIGAGLLAISAGFTALAAAGTAGAAAVVASLSIIILGIADLIPELIKRFGGIVVAICDVLIEAAPKIAETILVVLTEVMAALVKYTPQIVESLMQFVIGVLDAFAANLPQLIVSAVNVIAAFFQGIVDALSGLDTTALLKGIVGVGLLAGLMYALTAVAGLVPGAMIGVLGMGVIIAELALVLAAIGALAQIPGLSWLIEEGGNFLQTIGTAIGQFIGGIVGGIAEGATSTLPQVGTNLSEFMTNLQPFLEGARSIDATMMEGVKALAEAILLLTGANILEGLAKFVPGAGSLTSFGEELGTLGTNLNTFATNLGTFDESKVATINCAANAIKTLAEVANSIPNEGGWAAKLFGDNSLASFGSQLPALATNLNAFATNLGTFDEAKVATVTCAANSIKALAEAAQSIDGQAGWAAKIFGDNSLATFGSQLPALGTNLNAFATNLGAFDETKVATVTCAAGAIKAFADAAKGIDGQAEWAKKIFGDNGLAAFSSEFGTLGTNLNAFATNLGTFTGEQVTTVRAAVSAIKAFSGLADADLEGAKKNLGGFGDKLVDFGSDLATFTADMPSVDAISSAVKGVKEIIGVVDDISNANTGALSKFSDNLKKIGDDAVDKFITAFTNNGVVSRAKASARTLVNKIVEATSEKKTAVEKAFESLASAGVASIKDKYQSFYNAGSYLVSGFCAGISDNDYKAEAKARAMAKAAAEAAEEALDINSPSKVFRKIGTSVPEGFAQGIAKRGDWVKSAVVGMSDTAVNGVKSTIAHISDTISGTVNTQPTIRPVLDLSDIQRGAGTIGNMLNLGGSVGVMTNAGAISRSMNARGQNVSNADVVSAIERLDKHLDSVGNTTYTIGGITYDDDSNIATAVRDLTRYARMERRI